MLPSTYIVQATLEDCAFIAKATLNAERGNEDIGMWDYFFNAGRDATNRISEELILQCLEKCSASIECSIIYYKYFFIAKSSTDDTPVGALSVSNSSSLKATILEMNDIASEVLGWDSATHEAAANRLHFLLDPSGWQNIPEEIFDNVVLFETMYVEASFRGQNIASNLIEHCMAVARDVLKGKRVLLMCASGNNRA